MSTRIDIATTRLTTLGSMETPCLLCTDTSARAPRHCCRCGLIVVGERADAELVGHAQAGCGAHILSGAPVSGYRALPQRQCFAASASAVSSPPSAKRRVREPDAGGGDDDSPAKRPRRADQRGSASSEAGAAPMDE